MIVVPMRQQDRLKTFRRDAQHFEAAQEILRIGIHTDVDRNGTLAVTNEIGTSKVGWSSKAPNIVGDGNDLYIYGCSDLLRIEYK